MNNGYIQRNKDGEYIGELIIEGVNVSPIEGMYFKKNDNNYLWIKRKKILEYDDKKSKFIRRERFPILEVYLKKEVGKTYNYIGTFMFLRFKFLIYGIWDRNMVQTKRLNLYVERLPMCEQNVIVSINKIKTNGNN